MSEHFILFGGRSHPSLTQEIGHQLNISVGKLLLETFPDGELFVQVLENVRGSNIFLLQSVVGDPNTHLMELLIMIDAFKRASARSISLVIPYFGYQRQDRKDKSRVAITAKLVANLIETAGASRVLTLDLHADQVQGFFDIPLDNLFARPPLISEVEKRVSGKSVVVVAPDMGSVKMARGYASCWGCDIAVIDKRRSNAHTTEVMNVIGEVSGKEVVMVDDICSTGGTLVNAAKACKEKGAKHVYACVAHGVFSEDAISRIEESCIDMLYVTNSVPAAIVDHPKINVVTIAPLLSEAISCIMSDRSISSLFKKKIIKRPSVDSKSEALL